MASLSDILNELGKRAKLTPQQITDMIANAELSKITVPDEVSSSILSNLLSVETAAHNYDVKKALKGQLMAEMFDPVDRELEGFLPMIGDDEWSGSWKQNKSTYDRLKSLREKLAEATEAKVNAAKGSGTSKEAQRQIEELSAQIKRTEQEYTAKIQQQANEFAQREEGFVSESYFGRFPYANDKIPVTASGKMAEYMIKEAAQKSGAKVVYNKDSRSLQLVNANDVSLPYIKDGAPVDFDTFANRTLAEAGLLKVNNPTPPAQPPAPTFTPSGNPKPQGNKSFDDSLYRQALEDAKKMTV